MSSDGDTFDLMSLPTELRELIYQQYCNAVWDNRLERKSYQVLREPPITRTSKAVRAESLPTWYARQQAYMYVPLERTDASGTQRLEYERRTWLARLSADKIKMLRSFEVVFRYMSRHDLGVSFLRIVFIIDLHKGSRSYTLRHDVQVRRREDDRVQGSWDTEAEMSSLRAILSSILDELVVNPGIGYFTADDLDRFAKLDGKALAPAV